MRVTESGKFVLRKFSPDERSFMAIYPKPLPKAIYWQALAFSKKKLQLVSSILYGIKSMLS